MTTKDVRTSSPLKTPKLQLTAEQSLTGESWIPPKKDTPRPRAKDKPKQDGESCSVVSNSLRPHGVSPWNSPGQNTGVGSLSLLQRIFPTQGSNPGLPYCRRILYQLSHKGSPRILEWVAYPFSSRSSRSRNQTGASCITGRFFTNWDMREAHQQDGRQGKSAFKIKPQGWNRSPAQVGCMRQVLRAGALGRPRGMGWGGRR